MLEGIFAMSHTGLRLEIWHCLLDCESFWIPCVGIHSSSLLTKHPYHLTHLLLICSLGYYGINCRKVVLYKKTWRTKMTMIISWMRSIKNPNCILHIKISFVPYYFSTFIKPRLLRNLLIKPQYILFLFSQIRSQN